MSTEHIVLHASDTAEEINRDAAEAMAGAEQVRIRTSYCIQKAADTGRKLTKEKEWVLTTFGKGQWEIYYKLHHPSIPERTARRWMALAAMAVANGLQNANTQRIGLSALDLTPPPKEHTPTSEAGKHAPVEVHANHLGLINKLTAWANDTMEAAKGELPPEYAAQLLADFKPVCDFIEKVKKSAVFDLNSRL